MSLKEYKRKRDFKKTSEPAGKVKATRGHSFVIQKHDASRLHYDFRLEYDGTLKSWAVPKGPSLDPSVKSLAVQVEDHPIEYATFEGTIPEGEYGGGTVMVWDRGSWEPEEDADQGFKKGRLKFTLHGEKLHGSWALVRMGGRAGEGGKNWLLIKHRDEAAKPTAKYDVTKREPLSVATGRDLDQIATDADAVWTSEGKVTGKKAKQAAAVKKTAKKKSAEKPVKKKRHTAPPSKKELAELSGVRKAGLPKEFQPQLATLASRVPTEGDWLHELKFDGYRIVAHVNGGKVRLVTRNDNDWTKRFQVVADALTEISVEVAIFDGEVVSLDEHGVSNFQKLQNALKTGDDATLVYYVFDLPYLNGYDLTEVPLVDRKETLARLLLSANPSNGGVVRYSDHIAGQGADVLRQACQSGMEGIVAKRADSVYHPFRSPDWLKVKCMKQQEFVIGGYSKPEGSRVGFGALLLGYYEKKDFVYAGRVGTGFTTQSLKELMAELEKRQVDEPAFSNPPRGAQVRGVTWVRPELVGEIEFAEWTSDGRLRHPSFNGLREDKPAKQVVREKEKSPSQLAGSHHRNGHHSTNGAAHMPTQTRKPSKGAVGDSKPVRNMKPTAGETVIGGVRLSHPDRVLYPEQGFTKRDLAEYYETVADWILPYVVGRPLTLVRCPEGYQGECFFQKHLTGSLPDAVRGVMVDVKGKQEKYVAIDDVSGLVALVQMGVLELHPWPAREDNLERPDQLVFDLDPGEGVTWGDIVHGAREVRKRLESAGLKTFLRTSGGKGLHIVVPLSRRNDWDDFKAFAKSVADAMTRDEPDRYIATLSKAKRKGKIFVDYLRNQRGATAVASYSTRRRKGAPVAVPIAWDELSTRTQPDMFNIKNLPKRLSKLKKDPWADFFKVRQSITRDVQAAFA
ncbi:MAG TPA: DNA ligase D [Lacipirellulaceae bacterium]|nr:DNA ligase D [Lacipirellulaceae bacterium]